MPVEFLTSEQEKCYGRYGGEPSVEQLEKYFHLEGDSTAVTSPSKGIEENMIKKELV